MWALLAGNGLRTGLTQLLVGIGGWELWQSITATFGWGKEQSRQIQLMLGIVGLGLGVYWGRKF